MAYILTFNKYRGLSMDEVYARDPDYVHWLADKSSVGVARRAADEVIAAAARKDDEVAGQLLAALRHIAKNRPHPSLKPYIYIHSDVRRDYACIEFCTHNLFTRGGFLSEVFMDEDWDMVQIATYHKGLEKIDEGHEHPRYKTREAGPTPTADAASWYAMRDNSEYHPLNAAPVTLAGATELLDQHLASKGGQ